MSILLRIAYDGHGFSGFARQAAAGATSPVRTVQGVLDGALSELYGQAVETRGASRTDAGVHAEGQLVAFEPPFEIPAQGIVMGVTSKLPQDAAVVAAWEEHAPDGGPVDVRGANDGKRYRYRIRCNRARDPFRDRYEWHLARRLDAAAMHAAAQHLVGTHDFSSFRAGDCQAKTALRTLTRVEVQGWREPGLGPEDDPGRLDRTVAEREGRERSRIEIHVEGHAFLKNMVRILAGTLVEVGLGRRDPDWIAHLLRQRDRRRAGVTAPAHGLTLVQVMWPKREHGS